MLRKLMIIFMSSLFILGDAAAERGEPMMAWPYFVQLDLQTYHGAMIDKCTDKYPAQAEAFRDAIAKWDSANSAAIGKIRGLIRERLKVAGELSEAQAEEQMIQASQAWTQLFLKMVSSTKESEWKETCAGKYTDYTLRSMDFEKHLSSIVAAIPNVPVRQFRP